MDDHTAETAGVPQPGPGAPSQQQHDWISEFCGFDPRDFEPSGLAAGAGGTAATPTAVQHAKYPRQPPQTPPRYPDQAPPAPEEVPLPRDRSPEQTGPTGPTGPKDSASSTGQSGASGPKDGAGATGPAKGGEPGNQPDPQGSTELPIQAGGAQAHSDDEAEKLYGIDIEAARTITATNSGNPPPSPQFTLKLTNHVQAWRKTKGNWEFRLLNDPNVALQTGLNFKPTDQFSLDVAKLIYDTHLLKPTELSLQANASVFLDKQLGAQLELEQEVLSNVSLYVDGTLDYGSGQDSGKTNWAVTGGIKFDIVGWGKKKK